MPNPILAAAVIATAVVCVAAAGLYVHEQWIRPLYFPEDKMGTHNGRRRAGGDAQPEEDLDPWTKTLVAKMEAMNDELSTTRRGKRSASGSSSPRSLSERSGSGAGNACRAGSLGSRPRSIHAPLDEETIQAEYSYLMAMEQENERRRGVLAAETVQLDQAQQELEQRRISIRRSVASLRSDSAAVSPSAASFMARVNTPLPAPQEVQPRDADDDMEEEMLDMLASISSSNIYSESSIFDADDSAASKEEAQANENAETSEAPASSEDKQASGTVPEPASTSAVHAQSTVPFYERQLPRTMPRPIVLGRVVSDAPTVDSYYSNESIVAVTTAGRRDIGDQDNVSSALLAAMPVVQRGDAASIRSDDTCSWSELSSTA
ncbi:hypothetical protein THASP1DRAFT_24726 [Thamnocephalis sphaerospora]|uniref:Peroxin-14 n=1 Tax=Thamnocephalis sphaerospora TaxID=78915 RepID=A0A4P9XNS1_9FUNG|nr:hypothetical protein THASP1DRAFT_24726 [Thamnocephalis sphaerospora]|eukprot:RKP07061.1 hypothetical protein THASP1DRAFT_24726 [Thamnocephalis sphaerospora]